MQEKQWRRTHKVFAAMTPAMLAPASQDISWKNGNLFSSCAHAATRLVASCCLGFGHKSLCLAARHQFLVGDLLASLRELPGCRCLQVGGGLGGHLQVCHVCRRRHCHGQQRHPVVQQEHRMERQGGLQAAGARPWAIATISLAARNCEDTVISSLSRLRQMPALLCTSHWVGSP